MAEYFDIRTPEGKLTGVVKERNAVHRDGDWHGASHIWIWRKDAAGEVELILQLRAPQKDSYPDCYDISSAGHLDAGEDYLTGAVRELSEELGIDAKPEEMQFIGWMTEDASEVFNGRPFINREVDALYLYHCSKEPEEFVLQPDEVSKVIWMKADDIMVQAESGSLKHCLRLDEVKRAITAAREQA